MLLVGNKAPDFKATALVPGNADEITLDKAFKEVSLDDYKGKWLLLLFYPLDFTGVCPTELVEYGKLYNELKGDDVEVLSVSTDSQFSHFGWRTTNAMLKDLPFPMLSDLTRKVSRDYGVLKEETSYALRGLFIIDPDGVIQYSVIHTEKIGRNTEETKRVLAALKTGGAVGCNWQPGDATL